MENEPFECTNLPQRKRNDQANKPEYGKIKTGLFETLKHQQEDTDDPLRFPE